MFVHSASASSITTRIKTAFWIFDPIFFYCASASSITTRIKTPESLAFTAFWICASASSITTRIKTYGFLDLRPVFFYCASASSITTRIKTSTSSSQVPSSECRASASSITTRIKTSLGDINNIAYFNVRVHLPLQQGLRPFMVFRFFDPNFVRVHLPLQQGLRQLLRLLLCLQDLLCASASSITTRIKT